jgi:prolyl oligopeptidase
MPRLIEHPPCSAVETVTDLLHGVALADPYRWLEDQDSPRTRDWLNAQTRYARAYLHAIPGREQICKRLRELLDVETYDSVQKVGSRYFFRKRCVGQEQPCIYMRQGLTGHDELLIDPAERGSGKFTAVKPIRVSPDGRLLLYEVKQGGERTGVFELLDIQKRQALRDRISRGYLRGFAFAPDSKSFYYVHETTAGREHDHRAAYQHVLGTSFDHDREIFYAGEGNAVRLVLIVGAAQLGFLVYRFLERTYADFYLWRMDTEGAAEPILKNFECTFAPVLLDGRILALTDRNAPNRRIVEILPRTGGEPVFIEVVPETDASIQHWVIAKTRIYVSYIRNTETEIDIFTLSGRPDGKVPTARGNTVRLVFGDHTQDEVLFECESFGKPIGIHHYHPDQKAPALWAERKIPFEHGNYTHERVCYKAKDGTFIPMFLAGRREVLAGVHQPTIMTSYGGYGISMTPQFSVFVAFFLEHGCLFALPNIRGGSEFGADWHNAAKRRNRQVAFDDFAAAAEWLIDTERSEPQRLAIFGGSNCGLLVGAAMTQRPELFRAVICMVPMLDMLRYHLFDDARLCKDEFGTAEDADDFAALRKYSPYHQVRNGTAYPASMFISGDADQNCNPMHARKMTARLQAANSSGYPILLDYSEFRGHSPVLPLSDRVEGLTDRVSFLCDQLGVTS